ncbi:glycerol-3-phosphate dehydrogenase/oxidase [Halobacteriovorax sp. HLS]|uniref:glycerol-3-phosphate dehydrogenase/oxidase n=1 Tax=Halobacteriovorax sp. HLS TaxID=2234000 RepID=UPI000FD9FA54|nr:FAD-dependent oxidoreductase [Halobacteriovorax sp. HLS]
MGDGSQLIHNISPLDELSKSHFNSLIVGGGIVGAGILRDLALHDVDTLLLEKKDFSSQTSQSSSKMLHGGIRYLENLDFALVYEALHEKNLWIKLAPHLAKAEKFYLPVYSDSLRPLWMVRAGIFLYDFLSSFQNLSRGFATKDETLDALKFIRSKGLKGAGIYSDAIVDDGKLTLEVIMDSLECPNALAISYIDVSVTKKLSDGHYECLATDELTGVQKVLTCENLIIATGPFTDHFMNKINFLEWEDVLLPSKGSHIWLDRKDFDLHSPVLLTPNDGRVIFVIPHDNRVLVGTTEVAVEEDYFDVKPTQEEIDYLLENLMDFFPDANITKDKILGSFAGIRPLVKEDSTLNKGKTAREHKVIQPDNGMFVIVGGKYTTFRTMAQDITAQVIRRQHLSYNPNKTKQPLRKKCQHNFFNRPEVTVEVLEDIISNELPRTYEDIEKRRMLTNDFKEVMQKYYQKHTL